MESSPWRNTSRLPEPLCYFRSPGQTVPKNTEDKVGRNLHGDTSMPPTALLPCHLFMGISNGNHHKHKKEEHIFKKMPGGWTEQILMSFGWTFVLLGGQMVVHHVRRNSDRQLRKHTCSCRGKIWLTSPWRERVSWTFWPGIWSLEGRRRGGLYWAATCHLLLWTRWKEV